MIGFTYLNDCEYEYLNAYQRPSIMSVARLENFGTSLDEANDLKPCTKKDEDQRNSKLSRLRKEKS